MEWSPQQSDALKKARQWLKHPNRQQVFRIFGYAGTGKTTLAKEIAANIGGSVHFGTFTGKASLVLRKKGCIGATTIHSMIYKVEDGLDGKPVFTWNQDSNVRHAALIIVDEVSMVDDELGSDLLRFGRPILVLGDPAQLPPIRGQGFFIHGKPDVMLTEIHRQAQDNPIIRLSMDVRQGGTLTRSTLGESRVIRRMDLDPADVMDAHQVIVGMNRTRRTFNKRIRQLLGRDDPMPVVDDRLICLRNDRDRQLLNGGMWTVNQVHYRDEWFKLKVETHDDPSVCTPIDVDVLEHFFIDTEETLDIWRRKQSDEFTYGYAITAHKSQGSEWPVVTIFDESAVFRENASRWLYTAITRAAEKVTIVI